MLAQAPTTEPTSPDILRRKASTTDGVGYETGYGYNLSGAMVEQTYPSGRVVKNVLDASGDLSMVQSARCMDAAAGTGAECTAGKYYMLETLKLESFIGNAFIDI